MAIISLGFDCMNKEYQDIMLDLDKLIFDINQEIVNLSKCGIIFSMGSKPLAKENRETVLVNRLMFYVINDSNGVSINIAPKSENIKLDDRNCCVVYQNSYIHYAFKVYLKENKIFYEIRILCLDEINKKENIYDIYDYLLIESEISYANYLKTKVWNETRKKKLKESGYKCQLCSKTDTELHVHHNTYERIGNEEMSDLIVLCEDCHKKFHNID